MATKIRLQRQGRKGRPIFHVVVADSRAPRDGRYIERLGIYNPNTNPATIDIDFDKTLDWIQKGASLTDTSRAILSYKGILHKNHLINGVKKGALTSEQVEEKFSKWLEEKDSKISGKINSLSDSQQAKINANLEREKKLKEAKAAKILLKNSALAEVVSSDENADEAQAEVAEAESTSEVIENSTEVVENATEVVENTNEVVENTQEEVAEENVTAEVETTTEESTSEPAAEDTSTEESSENTETQE